jgi:AcrR family transcriptional regulator
LEVAALGLYGKRGYENTTVADIAARAGLTERTFYRYFEDKREVLFSGQAQLEDHLANWVENAPDISDCTRVLIEGLVAAAGEFPSDRAQARRRKALIGASAELRERELFKLESLTARMAHALVDRGIAEHAAKLSAEIATLVFKLAYERWVSDETSDTFAKAIDIVFAEVRALGSSKKSALRKS